MKRMPLTTILCVLAMASALCLAAHAQVLGAAAHVQAAPSPPVPQPPTAPRAAAPRRDPEMDKLIETVMAARLAKELDLNDEQTVLMVRRLFDYKDQMAELKKQRQDMVKKLKAALSTGEPSAQIEDKLNELVANDAKIADFKKVMYQRVAKGLTIPQKAKVYVFLNEFDSDMRRLIQQARERVMERNTPPPRNASGGPAPQGAPQPPHAQHGTPPHSQKPPIPPPIEKAPAP